MSIDNLIFNILPTTTKQETVNFTLITEAMKAILEFNLDDIDDEMAHNRCVKALDISLVLWQLVNNSKKTIENEISNIKCSKYDALDAVFKHIYDLLEEHDVNPDKLIV